MTLTTRTGGFPIGFRRGWSDWLSDLSKVIDWTKSSELGLIDLGQDPKDVAHVLESGLKIGSVDLLAWQGLLSSDSGKRAESVAKNADYIAKCGAQNYFCVMLPEDPKLPRKENFGYMVDSLNKLAPALEAAKGRLVIEGWPGPGALCCTPETYRATFKECPSKAIGINYDPSHLLRMGIDPIRFLNEFVGRVGHVHGKDCEVVADDLYEYGTEQPATFKPDPYCGASAWRYTIPGHGGSNWLEILRILKEANYNGAVCIELEDANYTGTPEAEQLGILSGAKFLSIC